MLHHGGEIHFGRSDPHAEASCGLHRMRASRRGDQGFRWNASSIEAFSSETPFLHEHHGNAEGRAHCRSRKPGGAAADHTDIRRENVCHRIKSDGSRKIGTEATVAAEAARHARAEAESAL